MNFRKRLHALALTLALIPATLTQPTFSEPLWSEDVGACTKQIEKTENDIKTGDAAFISSNTDSLCGYYAVRSNLYRQRGDLDLALQDIDHILALKPSTVSALTSKASIEMAKGDYQAALQVFATLRKSDPTNVCLMYDQNQCFRATKNYPALLKNLDLEVSTDPKTYLGSRADVYEQMGDNNKAIADLNKLVQIAPVWGLFPRAIFYLRQSKLKEALADLDELKEKYEEDTRAYVLSIKLWQAKTLLALGRKSAADALLLEICKSESRSASDDGVIAESYLAVNQPAKAISFATRAISEYDNAAYRIIRGHAYEAMKNSLKARDDYAKAIQLSKTMDVCFDLQLSLADCTQRLATLDSSKETAQSSAQIAEAAIDVLPPREKVITADEIASTVMTKATHNELAAAEQLAASELAKLKRSANPNRKDVASLLGALAFVQNQNKKPVEAEKLYLEQIEQLTGLPDSELSLFVAWNSLHTLYAFSEPVRYPDAIKALTEVLKLTKKQYGENSDNYLLYKKLLADTYGSAGNKKDQQKTLEELVQDCVLRFHENSEKTAEALLNLSTFFASEGDEIARQKLLLRRVNALTAVYGANSKEVASGFKELIESYVKSGNPSDAELLLEKQITSFKAVSHSEPNALYSNHDLIESYTQLSALYKTLKRSKEFESALREALKLSMGDMDRIGHKSDSMREEAYRSTISSIDSLVRSMDEQKRYLDSLELREVKVKLVVENEGLKSFWYSSELNSISQNLITQGKLADAERVLKDGLKKLQNANARETVKGQASLLLALITLYERESGSNTINVDSFPYYEQLIELTKQSNDSDTNAATRAIDKLALTCLRLGNFAKASSLFLQELEILKAGEKTDQNLHFVGVTLNYLGDAQKSSGDLETANKSYLEALAIYDELIKPTHVDNTHMGNPILLKAWKSLRRLLVPIWYGETSMRLAIACQSAGNFVQAESYYKQAIKGRVPNGEGSALCGYLDGLAGLYELQGRTDLAESTYRRSRRLELADWKYRPKLDAALERAEKMRDKIREHLLERICEELANSKTSDSDRLKRIKSLATQAMALCKTGKSDAALAMLLALGETPTAEPMDAAGKILSLAMTEVDLGAGSMNSAAEQLNRISKFAQEPSQLNNEILEYVALSREKYFPTENNLATLTILSTKAENLNKQDYLNLARINTLKALSLASMGGIGTDYLRGALRLYKQGLAASGVLSNTDKGAPAADVVASTFCLSQLLTRRGYASESRSLMDDLVDYLVQQKPNRNTALECIEAADNAMLISDYAAAQRLLEFVRSEVTAKDPALAQASLIGLADLAFVEGDLSESAKYADLAVNDFTTAGAYYLDRPYLTLSRCQRARGDFKTATLSANKSLDIKRKRLGSESPELVPNIIELANILVQDKNFSEAASLLQQANVLAGSSKKPELAACQGDVESALAELYLRERDLPLTRVHLMKAMQLHQMQDKVLSRITDENSMASLQFLDGNIVAAKEHAFKAARLTDTYVQCVFPQLSFAEQCAFIDIIKEQMGTLLTCCTDQGSLPTTYDFLCRWKGLLSESLRRQVVTDALTGNKVAQEKLQRLSELRRSITTLTLSGRADHTTTLTALTIEKEKLEREINAFLGKSEQKTANNISAKQLIQCVKNDEQLLDFYQFIPIGETAHHYGVIVSSLSSNSVFIDIGPASAIESTLKSWLLALSQPARASVPSDRSLIVSPNNSKTANGRIQNAKDSDERTLGPAVTSALITPFAQKLVYKKVIICPDGELSLLPWSLLLGGTNQVQWTSQSNSPRELIREEAVANSPQSSAVKPTMVLAGAIDFGSTTIPTLPATSAEVRAIEKIAMTGGISPTVLTGREPTKERVVKELPTATFVHLATHGFFANATTQEPSIGIAASSRGSITAVPVSSSRNPLVESGVYLAAPTRAENAGEANSPDTIGSLALTAENLVGLNMSSCNLVTLSACETGLGEQVSGQGVMGLRSALIAAGARSVLMSLWKVDDAATRKLMEEFYSNLWSKKMSKVEALSKAQETIRLTPQWSQPYYWAGWSLVGEAW